jgi:ketosteroid isomerase-like protein
MLSMNKHCLQSLPGLCIVIAASAWLCPAADPSYAGSAQDRAALERTGEAIRAAFGRGDLDEIMAYHHPDVIKALASDKYLVGREAVRNDLMGTFRSFTLRFETSTTENIYFQGDTAVEESLFLIKGIPKREGVEPFEFRGRSLVVYVRDRRSPTGWASIREIIQPAR